MLLDGTARISGNGGEVLLDARRCIAVLDGMVGIDTQVLGFRSGVDIGSEENEVPAPPHGHMFANQYLTLKRTYKIVMWDLVTRDYSKKLRGPQVLANVMRYARNGSIITFHDSLKSWCNGNLQYALPRAIDFLKEEGYEFKVL